MSRRGALSQIRLPRRHLDLIRSRATCLDAGTYLKPARFRRHPGMISDIRSQVVKKIRGAGGDMLIARKIENARIANDNELQYHLTWISVFLSIEPIRPSRRCRYAYVMWLPLFMNKISNNIILFLY